MRAALLTAALLCPAGLVAFQDSIPSRLTCDAGAIKPESYRLTTEAQALNITTPPYRWWDKYDIGRHPKDLKDINGAAIAIAERARALDDGNLLAHAQLAREYVVAAIDARDAREEWRRTLDARGAIVWTATLPDVDLRSYFLLAFDRQGLRIYRFGQLAGAFKTSQGEPVFPGPDRVELWRALGGCLPAGEVPAAEVAWADVREIEAGAFTLAFRLNHRIDITSDRRTRKNLDTLVVRLHGVVGGFDSRVVVFPPVPVRPAADRPARFQERVRSLVVEFFDPERRIEIPRQRKGFGW
jgi:hypothetical protein